MHIDTWGWRMRRRMLVVVVMIAIAGPFLQVDAQWFKYPSPRAPRTSSGAVDLSAATPRLTNGKPDLSGVWMTAEPACVIRGVLPLAELVKLIPPTRKCPPRTASFSRQDRKSTRLNSSHSQTSYAVFCLKQNMNRC